MSLKDRTQGQNLMNIPGKTEAPGCCGGCGAKRLLATCMGCGMELCESCARFELIGSGCGCVWPVYYCPGCVRDPSINPNALLREPEI